MLARARAREEVLALAQDTALSDADIVGRVRAGDRDLFEVLMRRHNGRVYRAVRAILRDEAEVEDAMQQTYLAVYKHLAQFVGAARFSTWLTRIAINEAGRRRRAARRLTLVDRDLELIDHPDDPRAAPECPEHRASSRELVTTIEELVDGLPEIYRTVFVLREVEGLPTDETAEVLAVSEDLIKTRLHRARAMVRERLGGTLDESFRSALPFGGARCDRMVALVFERLIRRPC
jgi:RNA polymerase sigma-70 factor (ECF subfamily)